MFLSRRCPRRSAAWKRNSAVTLTPPNVGVFLHQIRNSGHADIWTFADRFAKLSWRMRVYKSRVNGETQIC